MFKSFIFSVLVLIVICLSIFATFTFLFLNGYNQIKEIISEKISTKISTMIYEKINATAISIENIKTLCEKGFEFPEEIEFLSNACEEIMNEKIKTIPELMKAIGNLAVNNYFKPIDNFVNSFSLFSFFLYIIFFIFYVAYLFFIFVYGKNESMLLFFIIASLMLIGIYYILNNIISHLFSQIHEQISLLVPSEFVGEVIKFLYEIRKEIIDDLILKAMLITSFLTVFPIVAYVVYIMIKIKTQQK